MEPKFNTSFIPKKSLQDVGGGAGNRYVGRRDVYGPSFFLSLLLFLLAIVASVGLFTYSNITENSIDEKITLLKSKKDVFSSDEINKLIRADTQIKEAKRLVSEHTTLSELFILLEKITLKRIQYISLAYEGVPNELSLVTLDGVSKNFQDVALQTEEYRNSVFFKDPIVRQLDRLEEEDVEFSIEIIIDPKLTAFKEVLGRTNVTGSANTTSQSATEVQGTAVTNSDTVDTASVNVNKNNTGVNADGTKVDLTDENVRVEDAEGSVINVNDTGAFVNTN